MFKNMKVSLLILIMVSLLVTGCGGNKAPNEDNKEIETKIITDILGREVEVPKNIQSIGVTPIPYASMIYAIDGTAEKLITIHPSAKKAYEMSLLKSLAPELATVSAEYIAADFSINIEEIINLKPDVMIVWSNQEDEIIKLEELKIPVIALTNGAGSDIEEMRKNMRIIGELLDKQEQTENLIAYNLETEEYFQSKATQISETDRPKVLYLRDKDLKASSSKSFNQIMIELSGGVNVASQVPGAWTEISMEQILAWDPEIIYLSNFDDFEPSDLYENSLPGQDWSNVTAVKNKRVYKTPLGIYRWDAPNAETPLLLKWMGEIQQPDVFVEVEIEKDIKDFYKIFFNYNLSQEELNTILKK